MLEWKSERGLLFISNLKSNQFAYILYREEEDKKIKETLDGYQTPVI